jgi:DNA-damage-inducible protein D
LLEREIIPENVPVEEDIKKLERRVNSETNNISKNTDKLT